MLLFFHLALGCCRGISLVRAQPLPPTSTSGTGLPRYRCWRVITTHHGRCGGRLCAWQTSTFNLLFFFHLALGCCRGVSLLRAQPLPSTSTSGTGLPRYRCWRVITTHHGRCGGRLCAWQTSTFNLLFFFHL